MDSQKKQMFEFKYPAGKEKFKLRIAFVTKVLLGKEVSFYVPVESIKAAAQKIRTLEREKQNKDGNNSSK